jgi:hypothetical protein
MALDLTAARPLPILVAMLAQMALGAVWFGVLARPWMAVAHPGRTKEEIQAGSKWPYAVAAASALLTAYALDVLMAAAGATDAAGALTLAFLAWLGLVAAAISTAYAFQWRPFALHAIDAGHYLARMLAAALVLALM